MTERASLRRHTLVRRQTRPARLDRLLPFFAGPEDLARITPPRRGLRALTPAPIRMQPGRVIDYTLRLAAIRHRWRSPIPVDEPPVRFVDEQLQGPYACWRDTHRFACCAQGTVTEDEGVYALPASLPRPCESRPHAFCVRPGVETIFDHRARCYPDFFGGRAERPPAAARTAKETHP